MRHVLSIIHCYFSYLLNTFTLLINYHLVTFRAFIEILSASPRILNFICDTIDIVGTWTKFGSQICTDFRITSTWLAVLPSSPDRQFIKVFRITWIESSRRSKTSTNIARRFLQKIKYCAFLTSLHIVRDLFVTTYFQ